MTMNSKDYNTLRSFVQTLEEDSDLIFSLEEKARTSKSFRECLNRNFPSIDDCATFINRYSRSRARVRAELRCFPEPYSVEFDYDNDDSDFDLKDSILESFTSDPDNFAQYIDVEVDTYECSDLRTLMSYEAYALHDDHRQHQAE